MHTRKRGDPFFKLLQESPSLGFIRIPRALRSDLRHDQTASHRGRPIYDGGAASGVEGAAFRFKHCSVGRTRGSHSFRRRTIESNQLAGYQQDLTVISNRLRGGQTVIHVLADSLPAAGFEPVEGGLEDLYFATLVQSRRTATTAAAAA